MSVVVLSGGVGGAKLVDGLARILPAGELTAIVNTGDDFTHLGLHIAPDIDSVFYQLAGKSDPVRGWGVVNESWNFMAVLAELGGDDWFSLGDRDLAMHVLRSRALAAGQSLSQFTAHIAQQAGLGVNLLPMSDDPVATIVQTDEGDLPFQTYFVQRQCAPVVRAIHFAGISSAAILPEAASALADPTLEAVIIAPSNPYLSVDPILSVAGFKDAICAAGVPVVAVSPLIGGQAVKGPTAKMMAELGLSVGNATIANHYAGLIHAMLIDEGDADDALGLPIAMTATLMRNTDDRCRVAGAALALVRSQQQALLL